MVYFFIHGLFRKGGTMNHRNIVFLLLFLMTTLPISAGSPIRSEFQVNTYTTGHQSIPSVALHVDGSFVVTWRSYGSFSPDARYASLQGQQFDSAGSWVGEQFQVNTYTTGSPSSRIQVVPQFMVVARINRARVPSTMEVPVWIVMIAPDTTLLGSPSIPRLPINMLAAIPIALQTRPISWLHPMENTSVYSTKVGEDVETLVTAGGIVIGAGSRRCSGFRYLSGIGTE